MYAMSLKYLRGCKYFMGLIYGPTTTTLKPRILTVNDPCNNTNLGCLHGHNSLVCLDVAHSIPSFHGLLICLEEKNNARMPDITFFHLHPLDYGAYLLGGGQA